MSHLRNRELATNHYPPFHFNAQMTPIKMHSEADHIQIAITSDSINRRTHIQHSMENSGIQVVLNESLTENFITKLETIETDVVLLDIESIDDLHIEYLDQLLDQSNIPIIINDVSALTLNEPKAVSIWHHKILQKIADITGKSNWDENYTTASIKNNATNKLSKKSANLAKNVWVLGASLGGPDAVKRFLSKIPADLPVTFIIAQHLGENFVTLLAEQLDRHTEFNVIVAKQGHVVKHQEALVLPTNTRLTINPIGAVEYLDITDETRYSPSINMAINDIALRYKKTAGAIIFSGMCDDGVEGCEVLIKQGGQVWVQSSESCVIGSMSDSVSKKVNVKVEGTPEYLARQLVSIYQKVN